MDFQLAEAAARSLSDPAVMGSDQLANPLKEISAVSQEPSLYLPESSQTARNASNSTPASCTSGMLGVHIVGEEATEIVHIGMMVMLVNGTAEMLDEICFNLPTLGELYKYAAFDVMLRSGRLEVPPPPFVRLSAPTT